MEQSLFVLSITFMKKGFYTKNLLPEHLNKIDEWIVSIVTPLMWHVPYDSKRIYRKDFGKNAFLWQDIL